MKYLAAFYKYIHIYFWYIFLCSMFKLVSCDIKTVTVQPLEAVRLHNNAQIRCGFQGTELQIQYITWTKEFIGGGQTFVYGYDSCANENRGYGSLHDRAILDIAKPTGLRQYRRELNNGNRNRTFSYDRNNLILSNDLAIEITDEDDMHIGSATLTIKNVRLQDEARYRCLVKTINGPADSHAQLLTVVALPKAPVIEGTSETTEGQDMLLTCNAHLGRPTGRVYWLMRNTTHRQFTPLPLNMSDTTMSHHQNGTSSATSRLRLRGKAQYSGATVRCEVTSRAMKPWEQRPYAQVVFTVLYTPRESQVIYDTTSKMYYCKANGNPEPTYIWTWILKDGTQTILSTNQFLDLSSIDKGGIHKFQCLASNVIGGRRNTIAMETTIDLTDVSTRRTIPDTTAATSVAPLRGDGDVMSRDTQTPVAKIGDPFVWANDMPRPMRANEKREVIPIWDVVISQVSSSIGGEQYDASSGIERGTTLNELSHNHTLIHDEQTLYRVEKTRDTTVKYFTSTQPTLTTPTLDSTNENAATKNANFRKPNLKINRDSSEIISNQINIDSLPNEMPFFESDIDKLSPENYDYFDNNNNKVENTVIIKNTAEASRGNAGAQSQNDVVVIDTPATTETRIETVSSTDSSQPVEKDVVEDTRDSTDINVESPKAEKEEFKVYLADLMTRRFDIKKFRDPNRPRGREVPLTASGRINFARLTKGLPFSSQNSLRKKLPRMNQNLRLITMAYEKELLNKNVKEENARELPPFTDPFMYDVFGLVTGPPNIYPPDRSNSVNYADNDASMRDRSDLLLHYDNVDYVDTTLPTGQFHDLDYRIEGRNQYESDKLDFMKQQFLSKQFASNSLESNNKNKNVNQYGTSGSNKYLSRMLPSNGGAFRPSYTPYKHTVSNHNINDVSAQQDLYDVGKSGNTHPFRTYQSQEDTEAEKYGIYEVEVNINPHKYDKTSLEAKNKNVAGTANDGYQNSLGEMYLNEKVFSDSNKQTANAFSHSAAHRNVGNLLNSRFEPGVVAKQLPEARDKYAYSDSFERVVRTTDQEFDCKQKETGSHGGGCRSFYKCLDGMTYRVECKAPHVYNSKTQNCDLASDAPSPCGDRRDCSSKPNGKYADAERACRYYYTCFQGMFLGHNECNPGTIFNEEKQVCDWADQTRPPCGKL